MYIEASEPELYHAPSDYMDLVGICIAAKTKSPCLHSDNGLLVIGLHDCVDV